jgi:hypothetical protein
MRIFIEPPNPSASPDGVAIRACQLLRASLILSARIGGIINDRAVVLVAPHDTEQAVAVLKKAGIEAIATE